MEYKEPLILTSYRLVSHQSESQGVFLERTEKRWGKSGSLLTSVNAFHMTLTALLVAMLM